MDKLVKHAIRMLEIVEGENGFFRNDAKRQADIARAVYDTILRVQALERKADRKTDSDSEIPNNCEYAENPSGDVWECGCFLDTYCEHQIYDRNPDGTINIVECGYEPKDEPQTCSVNGRPYSKCGSCEHFKCTADEPQTEVTTDCRQTDCPWK